MAKRKPTSVTTLTELGRERLSKSFFMRDMLFSEVAAIHGLNNAPDDPELALAAGRGLCENILERLQDHGGRLAIRSATDPARRRGSLSASSGDGPIIQNAKRSERSIWLAP